MEAKSGPVSGFPIPGAAMAAKGVATGFPEALTVILWVFFGLSVSFAAWGLVRCSTKPLLLAALLAGVFACFFFWDPCGRLAFAWPLALVVAAVVVKRRRGRNKITV